MQQFLDSPLFKVLLVVLVIGFLGRIVATKLFPPKSGVKAIRVRCTACGWVGQVGKYNRRCSKCNGTALREQR